MATFVASAAPVCVVTLLFTPNWKLESWDVVISAIKGSESDLKKPWKAFNGFVTGIDSVKSSVKSATSKRPNKSSIDEVVNDLLPG